MPQFADMHPVTVSDMSKKCFEITVETRYLPEDSNPAQSQFCFAYFVTIKNSGEVGAQLVARHWVIEDAAGSRQEVRGLGVVGQQPFLSPGEVFRYNSGTRISSPLGSMHGTYICVSDDAEVFEAAIPAFSLRVDAAELGADLSAMLH